MHETIDYRFSAICHSTDVTDVEAFMDVRWSNTELN